MAIVKVLCVFMVGGKRESSTTKLAATRADGATPRTRGISTLPAHLPVFVFVDMSQIALIVGGTSGIGHGIALSLASKGVDIVIAGRSEKRGAEIVAELNGVAPEGNHTFSKIDAFDLSAVKALADDHKKRLDFLVMTQSMATMQGFTPTKDGFDQKMQLHYFSRVLLAQTLAPTLADAPGGGKVLSVLSAGVHAPFAHYDTDFNLKKKYSIKNAADAAGFYNDVAFNKLAQENPAINFTHAAPGFVNTNWGSEFPLLVRWCIRALQPLGISYRKCGTILTEGWVALGPGFHLLDKDGKTSPTVTKLHEECMASSFWTRTQEALQPYL